MNTATDDASESAGSVGLLHRSLTAKTSRTDHLESLLHSLDTAILLFLGVTYCCDNLTFLLLLRAGCEILYTRSTQFSPTIVANLICLLTHVVHARPEGSKATRAYLHGGLICDFVGELGPISRSKLLLLDVMILALQLCYLAISHELDAIKTAGSGEAAAPTQDIEAEEAGVRRQEQEPIPSHSVDDGIELQPMLAGTAGMSYKPAHGEIPDEEMILTVNLRQSLFAVLKKNTAANISGSDTNAGRLVTLIDRISAARAAAVRA